MDRLLPLHLMRLPFTGLSDAARSGAAGPVRKLRDGDREAGGITLEIAVIAVGLFLLTGVAVLALTAGVNNWLDQ